MISVFTPSHRPTWLDDCYESLRTQTDQDWEWIVLLNGGNRWRPPVDDARVRVILCDDVPPLVGALKREAVALCTGDLLVELDHDDMLASTALARLREAHEAHPDAGLIYSDTAQITADGKRDDGRFDPGHGWEYEETTVDGVSLLRCISLEPTPHNVGLIWYAPNHVRAFSRAAYDAAGGYDGNRYVLDDQALMARLYEVGPFVRIPEVLYLQRIHGGNTQTEVDTNALIQQATVQMYEERISDLALAWCKRETLVALDLGAAHGCPPDYTGVDLHPGPNVTLVGDVFEVLAGFADGAVGIIRAFDFLEHLDPRDKVRIINECYRVLAHGGLLLTMTPSTDGRGAWQDPTHLSGWNENSWWYFTDGAYAAYVPEITARFQTSLVRTWYPSDFHAAHDISYVTAYLVAVKGGARQGGYYRWDA